MTFRLTIDIPGNEWLTANGRYHWAETARRTRHLRERANWTARSARAPRLDAARIDAYVHGRTRGRMDPANAHPTTKALVDGLVDAGLLPDDDSRHLDGPYEHRGSARPGMRPGWHRVTLIITPMVYLADEDDAPEEQAA